MEQTVEHGNRRHGILTTDGHSSGSQAVDGKGNKKGSRQHHYQTKHIVNDTDLAT